MTGIFCVFTTTLQRYHALKKAKAVQAAAGFKAPPCEFAWLMLLCVCRLSLICQTQGKKVLCFFGSLRLFSQHVLRPAALRMCPFVMSQTRSDIFASKPQTCLWSTLLLSTSKEQNPDNAQRGVSLARGIKKIVCFFSLDALNKGAKGCF